LPVTEPQFTSLLGTYFSATRGEVDQRALSRIVKQALYDATSGKDALAARWLGGDSWRWTTRGRGSKPDVVATDDHHDWVLTIENKSFGAGSNATSLAQYRRDVECSDARLQARGLVRDELSRQISEEWLASDPIWDEHHPPCDWAGHRFATATRDGVHRAGAHQCDTYTSQF